MLLRLLPATAAVAAISVLLLVGVTGGAAPRAGRLPDLRQELPSKISVTGKSLGFASAVSNVGAGPLTVSGRRPDRADPEMVAEQLIRRPRGPSAVVGGVGRLRYVRSADHEHWHLLPFMRYELRNAGPGAAVRRDRKTGFCLGDRYPVRGERLPARARREVYTSRCGLRATGRLHLVQGISVGLRGRLRRLSGGAVRLAAWPARRTLRAGPPGQRRPPPAGERLPQQRRLRSAAADRAWRAAGAGATALPRQCALSLTAPLAARAGQAPLDHVPEQLDHGGVAADLHVA
jgi:hypothetical protein